MKNIQLMAMLLFLFSCNEYSTNSAEEKTRVNNEELVKRGEHLVTITGCNDCHSPKKISMQGLEIIPETMLSGFQSGGSISQFDTLLAKRGIVQMNEDMTAAAGPWGISFAPNLTSDATGAGSWPLENFKIALKHGKAKGIESGRMLLPPMPWFNYKSFTDEEVAAIHAYLRTVKPVKNVPPEPILFSNPGK